MLVHKQAPKSIGLTEFKLSVHFDRVEGANFDADLTAHADGDVDVKGRRLELVFADKIWLFRLVFLNENALRRAFLFADLASDATKPLHRIAPVENKKRKVSIVLFSGDLLFRILDRGEVFRIMVTPDKILCRLSHPFNDSCAKHRFVYLDPLRAIRIRFDLSDLPRPRQYLRFLE